MFPRHSLLLLLTVYLSLPCVTGAQSRTGERFDRFVRLLSPEKVFLHTDREVYNIGDTIWFRGYLENVAPQAEYAPCNYLYVELFSAQWERTFQLSRQEKTRLRQRVKIKRGSDGTFTGCLPLTEDLNSGVATLRAYSYWMLNGNPQYLYTKDIEIRNPMKDEFVSDLLIAEYTDQRTYDELGIRNPFRKELGARTGKKETAVDLQFLPESGRYLPGRRSVLAVKAVNQDGLGVRVEGTIRGNEGLTLATFKTNDLGLGKVSITVPAGMKRLRAVAETAVEQFRFEADVPLPETAAVVIRVIPDEKGVSIAVADAGLTLPSSTYLAVYDRSGFVLQSHYAESRKGKRVNYTELNPGIHVVAVFDENGQVYAERPFFVFPNGAVRASVALDRPRPGRREKVTATVKLSDAAGRPVSGDFSLAVTDEEYAPDSETAHTLESWMLLGSELKGLVEQPQRYFDASRPLSQRIADADLLLLSQGWRYYDLSTILQNKNAMPRFGKEYTQSLSGYVNGVLGRSRSATICFAAPSLGYTQIAELDSTAYFALNGLDFPESTQFLVGAQGNGKVFKKWYMPILNPDYFAASFQPVHYLEYAGYSPEYGELARRSYATTDGSLVYTLAPARIEAPRTFRLSPYPDDTFNRSQYRDEKMLQPYADYDLLSYIFGTCPELQHNAGRRMDERMRGASANHRIANVFVNGVPYDLEELRTLRVSDVQAFVYIEGMGAAKYNFAQAESGTGHTPPAILIAVRYPEHSAANVTAERPLGWQRPVRFYAPKYESAASKKRFEPMRPTLHWEPELQVVNGQARVSFYSSDHTAPWRFVMEGISDGGRPVSVNILMNDAR